ncbi:MAG: hypothetical protein NTU65_02310 [Cyanobacteria bacterium]|nr:hypothetical protein [Cyanobacteriota bacterium]
MADPSALPTDDDQQPGQTGASLESPLGEAPGEPVAPADPGAPDVPPADQAPAPELASPAPLGPEANQPEPSPEPTPEPVQAGPAVESEGAGSAAAMASEPEPAAPEPAPLPEPEVVPLTPPAVPTVATTIDLPARGDSTGAGAPGEGGEWALLLSKLQAWLGSGQLQAQLQAARTPFTLVAGLIAIYGALLAVIDSFPLAPGLLELVGLVAVVRFGLVKLVRSQERRALIEGLQQRWKAFQGKA